MERNIAHIKAIRKELGIKQYVLAEILELQQSNYANIENGKLVLNTIPDIIKKAENYLIPILDKKISSTQFRLELLLSMRNQSNKK